MFERLVRGETCIEEVSDAYKQALLDRNIVRLVKGRDGSVDMSPAETFGDIPQLAGVAHAFDLAEEFGVDPKAVLAWDITTQLAVASGLLACGTPPSRSRPRSRWARWSSAHPWLASSTTPA